MVMMICGEDDDDDVCRNMWLWWEDERDNDDFQIFSSS